MTGDIDSQRHRRRKPLNLPTPRRKTSKENHDSHKRHNTHIHPLKALENLRHLLKEITVLRLLRRRTPLHINTEHMRQQRQIQMETQPAKENSEQRHPREVLEQTGQKALFAETVAEDGEGDVADAGEDDD